MQIVAEVETVHRPGQIDMRKRLSIQVCPERSFFRVWLLTIDDLLNGTQRAEHPDYEPDFNFKKAKAEPDAEQQSLI